MAPARCIRLKTIMASWTLAEISLVTLLDMFHSILLILHISWTSLKTF
jgi:hypothetical protein